MRNSRISAAWLSDEMAHALGRNDADRHQHQHRKIRTKGNHAALADVTAGACYRMSAQSRTLPRAAPPNTPIRRSTSSGARR